MKCRKVAAVPAKVDLQEQEAFKKEKLEPRIQQAKAGKRDLYFVDAAHFVHGAFLGFLWCFARVFVRSPSGRQRYNVLAALHATTLSLVSVCNNDYINSDSVCELLRKIAALRHGVPITVVLDNARYQHCALVLAVAKRLRIELLFLPPYSPNLNLIERLWKFVKKKALYSKYYATFQEFKAAISEVLDQTTTTHQDELRSLLTLKFQTFKESDFITI
jgi:transposase